MLRLETNLAAEFGRRYANETAIIAWDLTDEPPFWIVQTQTTDAMAINWTRLIASAIRREDKLHPIVVGTSGEEVGHGPFRPDNIAKEVDFFSVHPFTIYSSDLFPDPMLSERGTYGAAFEIALANGAGPSRNDPRDGRIDCTIFAGASCSLRPPANVFGPGSGIDWRRSLVLHRRVAGAVPQGAIPANPAGDALGNDDLGSSRQAAGYGVQEVFEDRRSARFDRS